MSASDVLPLVASGRNVFTETELDAIEQMGEGLNFQNAAVGDYNQANPVTRITRVASIARTPNAWIYDRLTRVVAMLNQRYRFELSTFRETMQFMVYRHDEGGHFDWHVDQGANVQRQLSLTLQLTDPSHYQGCDLQFRDGDEIRSAPRERGTLIAFPSHVLHRVSPITAGTRKAIVAWVAGG